MYKSREDRLANCKEYRLRLFADPVRKKIELRRLSARTHQIREERRALVNQLKSKGCDKCKSKVLDDLNLYNKETGRIAYTYQPVRGGWGKARFDEFIKSVIVRCLFCQNKTW